MFIAIRLSVVRAWVMRAVAAIIAAVLILTAISYRYPLKYLDIIEKNSAACGIDPALVCAVIHAESKFAEEALSHKGASGLMQITQGTADWIAGLMNIPDYSYNRIFEPSLNISIGCRYMEWLLKQYKSVDLAVAAYNAGSGNVDKWLKDPKYSADGRRLNAIPFKETRDYVNRVYFNKWIYDKILRFKNNLKMENTDETFDFSYHRLSINGNRLL